MTGLNAHRPSPADLAKPDIAALARLLPMWPHELADSSMPGRRRRIALLARALRQERQRGLAGHWTYDLARHAALKRHYDRECLALASIQGAASQKAVEN
jgi:hypothetical protein